LRHVCRITAELAPWVEVGPVDAERLVFVPITGGAVSGSISGKVLPGGGDWARIISSDHVAVEARYLMQTDDGIVIDVVNTGIARHVDGFDSPIGYFATRPVFRVSGDRLEWMNRSVFVGWATSTPAATTIDIYEIQPPDDED
ncbi:MAG: DUF3237 domain-containing protein, partial [Microbacterium sp.]|nr:DUF3237 domain-containing protein [Microbacterium sp.]